MRWAVGALCLFACSSSQAAIALVQKAISDSCSVTISANTSGNLIAVFCEGQTGLPSAVADNASGGSNTYTEVLGSRGAAGSGVGITNIWYSQTIHGGATTVTCTSASSCYGAGANEYSGTLAAGNPVDTSSGTVGVACIAGNCTGAAITTLNAGDVIFSAGIPNSGLTGVTAPYTDFLGGTGNGQASCDYFPGTTVTASAAVWTDSNPNDAIGTSVAAFLPAAGGGGGSPTSSRRVLISE